MRKDIYTYIICAAVAASMVSCQYKDFDEYDGTVPVKVVLDYKNSGCVTPPVVSRVYFYPVHNEAHPYYYDVKDSSVVNLPTGQMQAFAYNNNSEINRTRGFQDEKAHPVIFTEKADYRGIYRKDSLDHSEYYDYPDVTYTAWRSMEVFGNEVVTRPDDNRVELAMKVITRPVTIEVRGIKNASFLSSVRMSLSGMQQDYSPVEGFTHSYVNIVADGKIDTKDPDRGNRSVFDDKEVIDTLRSSLQVFGIGNQQHELNVFLNGGNWHKVLSFDVTEQLNKQLNTTNTIHVVVETDHNIKNDVPVQGGFDIKISDWDDITVPIDMR